MKYLVVPDDKGQYIDKDNNRFNVIYGGFVVGPRASEFKEFDTLKHALEYYNLVDSNAPVEEEVEEQPTVSETESVEEGEEQ